MPGKGGLLLAGALTVTDWWRKVDGNFTRVGLSIHDGLPSSWTGKTFVLRI